MTLPRFFAAVMALCIDHFCIATVSAHPERRRRGLTLLWIGERAARLARRMLPPR